MRSPFTSLILLLAVSAAFAADNDSLLRSVTPGQSLTLSNLNLKDLPTLKLTLKPDPKAQLVFSDMPEYFRSGNGIALREDIKPGLVRFYLYHVPTEGAGSKVISATLENRSDQPLTLRLLRRALPPPGDDYYKIGKAGLVGYFDSKPQPPQTLAPHERIIFDPELDKTTSTTDQLVHALYEFELDQPARLTVFQRTPADNSLKVIDTLGLLPRIVHNKPSGAGRGVFSPSDYTVTAETYDTASGPAQIIVADGKSDPWVRGTDSIDNIKNAQNKGNYGVMYHITLLYKSSDNRALALLFTNPHAGQWCGGAAGAVSVSDATHPARTISLPSDKTSIKIFPECALIQRFLPTTQPAEIHLTYSPPGASCLPTPILLIPYTPAP